MGKYDARQYYRMIGMKECQIIYESRSYYIDKLLQKDKKRLDVLYGSNWKWLNQYEFSLELGDIDVLSIPGGEEPQVDFAACGDKMLVSSKAAKFLLEDKVLNKKQLFPCRFLKSSPFGYENIQISQCAEFRKRQVLLTGEEIQAVQKEYDNFLQQKRPKKKATLKKALQLLKEAKRNEPEYYNVPLENEICDRLKKSEYEVLLPYFKISNGMALSDEYRFLSYQEMEKETNEYKILKGLEEGISLLDGIVIAKAMDGDIVIMADKKVVRYSHEDWSVWDEWPDTETFIEEVILCL